ncbi:MAG: VCBS repeat-containing protein [Nitrospirota bacterium]
MRLPGRFSRALLWCTAPLFLLHTAASSAQETPLSLKDIASGVKNLYPAVTGTISKVEADHVVLSLGRRDGLFPGIELQAFRPGDPLRHPITGEPLGVSERDLGRIFVTRVDEDRSLASADPDPSGKKLPLAAGDRVRITAAPIRLAVIPADASVPASLRNALIHFLTDTGRFRVLDSEITASLLIKNGISRVPRAGVSGKPGPSERDADIFRTLHTLFDRHHLLILRTDEAGGRDRIALQLVYPGRDIAAATIETPVDLARAVPPASAEPPLFARQRNEPIRSLGPGFRTQFLAWGDLLGNGKPLLVVSTGNSLEILQPDGSGLAKTGAIKGDGGDEHLSLDAADLDGDGRAEIVVSNLRWNEPRSSIYAWDGREAKALVRNHPGLLRVEPGPDGKPRLLGAAAESPRVPVHEYRLGPEGLTRSDPVSLPKGGTLYSAARIHLPGTASFVHVLRTPEDKLQVIDQAGRLVFETKEALPGWESVVDLAGHDQPGGHPLRLRVPHRLTAADLDGDGVPEIVTGTNIALLTFTEYFRGYREGEIHAFRWTGKELEPLWKIGGIPGFVSDFAAVPSLPRTAGQPRRIMIAAEPTAFAATWSLDTARLADWLTGKGTIHIFAVPAP